MILPAERLEALQQHCMLLFTGISRVSAEIAEVTIKNLPARTAELRAMQQMVDLAVDVLSASHASLEDFGRLLHETWMLKRRLAPCVSNATVDQIYDVARRAGAIGGKLLGAGGGGFLLLFVRPGDRARVGEALSSFVNVPFRFETSGSRIVLYQPDGW
jgi:D-glycero-alpha-D-manno-heptose-7-phosphate kinase